jgi:hypothetical protein
MAFIATSCSWGYGWWRLLWLRLRLGVFSKMLITFTLRHLGQGKLAIVSILSLHSYGILEPRFRREGTNLHTRASQEKQKLRNLWNESHKTKDMSYSQPGSFLIHITGCVTGLTLDEQELFILPEHMGSPTAYIEVRCFSILFFCVLFCISLFFLFRLLVDIVLYSWNTVNAGVKHQTTIVLSVVRITTSNYPFGIFKLFWSKQ